MRQAVVGWPDEGVPDSTAPLLPRCALPATDTPSVVALLPSLGSVDTKEEG